jgi:uncharacterized protein (DUF4415 family)
MRKATNIGASAIQSQSALPEPAAASSGEAGTPMRRWSEDSGGRLFRPRKEPISIRVDTDVLDWLRRRADHYQTEINNILRETMIAETHGSRRT